MIIENLKQTASEKTIAIAGYKKLEAQQGLLSESEFYEATRVYMLNSSKPMAERLGL